MQSGKGLAKHYLVKLPVKLLTQKDKEKKSRVKPVEVVDIFNVAEQTQDVTSCDVGRSRFVVDEAAHVSLQHHKEMFIKIYRLTIPAFLQRLYRKTV